MRNGNNICVRIPILLIKRSYPTYEEWKRRQIWYFINYRIIRSYPTYEEWKHMIPVHIYLYS